MSSSSNIHAQAFNLARRNSIRNENDLLQENFFEEEEIESPVTEKHCCSLLKDASMAHQLPIDCQRFPSVRARQSETNAANHNIAFQGMNPNETLEAIRAREHGREIQAKLTRRLTSNKKYSKSTWF